MSELNEMPGEELLAAVRDRRASVAEVAQSCLRRIEEREPQVHAFAHHDPDLVLRSARELDRHTRSAPLRGLPVGVKDLIDTVDQPSEYGSPIYRGRRPHSDAAVVTRLRAAGALVAGKTVTTEFALFHPGVTANPRDTARTPGGSSSGSAAAVADNMLAVAIGTQTAGSIIRPASFCGVVGFKPTFGAIDRTGVKLISSTLDTLGLFARNVTDIAMVYQAIRADSAGARPLSRRMNGRPSSRLGILRTDRQKADEGTRAAFDAFVARLDGFPGLESAEVLPPADFDHMVEAQTTVMEFEVARNLQYEYGEHGDLLSEPARAVIERGLKRSETEYVRAKRLAERIGAQLPRMFHGLDGIVTPAAMGEAPLGLAFTGDPLFCRTWTLLRCPALSLPLLRGAHGLPIGVQLVGRPHHDDALLATAAELMNSASSDS
ncbi:amidase [Streptomyces himalayensis]|uniref:Amidase n=1 Tax=Streptomyces himalayensis subsp. himalayensis TaxID=2756131 RepID=A0A7W0DST3_9ACTN|nr:amidase [Streptomyces himalayensis]MBA2950605.1 amidase [Streptomyces himalayensis subsp. himalayensis]